MSTEDIKILYTGINADRSCITVGTSIGFMVICNVSGPRSIIKHGIYFFFYITHDFNLFLFYWLCHVHTCINKKKKKQISGEG